MFNTEQVLREVFGYEEWYISRFQSVMAATSITLDPFFLGLEYSKEPYTLVEREQIVATLLFLVEQQFTYATRPNILLDEVKTYTASGGAPGTGKTFALEKMHGINVSQGMFPANAIYIGPDSVVLPQMDVYLRDCADPNIGPLKAYEKWRAASNFIANFMMIKAIVDGVNIVHDTTATNPKILTILDILGNEAYQRNIHFYFADKAAREAALDHRKQKIGYVVALNADQKTAKSENKAEAAFERIADGSYLGRVDNLTLYAQQGEFYLGRGDTVAFAVYNPQQDANVQILANGQQCIDHLLQEVDSHENLKPELQAAVHQAIKQWQLEPEVSTKVIITRAVLSA